MSDVIDTTAVEVPAPATVHVPQPTAPPQAHAAPVVPAVVADEESEGEEIVDVWKNLYDEVDKQIARVGGKVFLENMQKAFATQTVREFKMNTYELIKKVVAIGGETAIELERLGADFEDLREEVIKHTRLFNDMMSSSIIAHSLNLSRLCLERVQDPEIRNLAQAIYNSMHPSTVQAATNGSAQAPQQPQAEPQQVQP